MNWCNVHVLDPNMVFYRKVSPARNAVVAKASTGCIQATFGTLEMIEF